MTVGRHPAHGSVTLGVHVAGVLQTAGVLGWGLKSSSSLLMSFQYDTEEKSRRPCVGLRSVPEQSRGQEASPEPSASSLPGAPVCRPPHSHAVLHLRGDRHAGKLRLPRVPFAGQSQSCGKVYLHQVEWKDQVMILQPTPQLLKSNGGEKGVAPKERAGESQAQRARRGWGKPGKLGLVVLPVPTESWESQLIEKTHSWF